MDFKTLKKLYEIISNVEGGRSLPKAAEERGLLLISAATVLRTLDTAAGGKIWRVVCSRK